MAWMWLLSIGISGASAFLGAFFSSYARKKGENKADREDVSALTKEVEKVKAAFRMLEGEAEHQRTMLRERARGAEGLRVVAASERLKAHQEAFTRWQKLATSDPHSRDAGQEAMDWWLSNCLYLDDVARQAFLDGVQAFSSRQALLQLQGPDRGAVAQEIVAEGTSLRAVGNRILHSLGLPPLKTEDIIVGNQDHPTE